MCIFGVYCISTDGWTKFRAFGNQVYGDGERERERGGGGERMLERVREQE